MVNPNNPNSSAFDQAGSELNNNGPANGNAGQPNAIDYRTMYNELESKLGDQGRELGEYRSFFEELKPILNELDASPEMVQAIRDGKINSNVARAVLEERFTISDAKIVDKAFSDVKKEIGNKAYDKASIEDISKLVEEKVGKAKEEFQEKFRENEEMQSFERNVSSFVERTPDFADYAQDIEKWLGAHENITDIEIAYYAVKGQNSVRESAAIAERERAEYAKSQALSAGGGGARSAYVPVSDTDTIDGLIAGKSNPNSF